MISFYLTIKLSKVCLAEFLNLSTLFVLIFFKCKNILSPNFNLFNLLFFGAALQTNVSVSFFVSNRHSHTPFRHSTFSGSTVTKHSADREHVSPRTTIFKTYYFFINFFYKIFHITNLVFDDIFHYYIANDLHMYILHQHIYLNRPAMVYIVPYQYILH